MRSIYIIIIFASIIFSLNPVFGEDLVIRHVPPESKDDRRSEYFINLLKLSLMKTENTDGSFRLEPIVERIPQGRAIEFLKDNKHINILWTMTSKERENELLPIRIPLLKGMLGHRVFIINAKDAPKFAAIKTIDELKQFKAGQGDDWPDRKILEANGIEVVTSDSYDELFSMLHQRKFDYLPRGINEAWDEVLIHQNKNLVVEETILIHYPAPIYFFLNKRDTKLADRIERGLNIALKDGSFDELFNAGPANIKRFRKLNILERKVLNLPNPLLPPETPLNAKQLWYDPMH